MITAIVITGVTYIYITKKELKKTILLLFSVFMIMIVLDTGGFIGEASHIGQAIIKIRDGDWQWLTGIITRKLMMNLKYMFKNNKTIYLILYSHKRHLNF